MEFPQVNMARKAFLSGKTLPQEFRRKQLVKLVECLDDPKNRGRICEAVYKDMRKSTFDATMSEIIYSALTSARLVLLRTTAFAVSESRKFSFATPKRYLLSDEKDLWIEPTFIGNIKRDDILMDGEIFGPILAFVTVNSSDEAIDFINSTERPLALHRLSSAIRWDWPIRNGLLPWETLDKNVFSPKGCG
ncbi:unnamed protein product [Allacma fusca]|uniref:Aldehyde dehydrogenase domain-containing protein n=1 Tax=Allacma fusca TaxID=39272 RepID=A0A8J2JF95_9HEXA|nr:unnamed protein product [Allacma fusca]